MTERDALRAYSHGDPFAGARTGSLGTNGHLTILLTKKKKETKVEEEEEEKLKNSRYRHGLENRVEEQFVARPDLIRQ